MKNLKSQKKHRSSTSNHQLTHSFKVEYTGLYLVSNHLARTLFSKWLASGCWQFLGEICCKACCTNPKRDCFGCNQTAVVTSSDHTTRWLVCKHSVTTTQISKSTNSYSEGKHPRIPVCVTHFTVLLQLKVISESWRTSQHLPCKLWATLAIY